jgi:hypothetical protein
MKKMQMSRNSSANSASKQPAKKINRRYITRAGTGLDLTNPPMNFLARKRQNGVAKCSNFDAKLARASTVAE